MAYLKIELNSKLKKIKPTLIDMGIEPYKGICDIKKVIEMTKIVGLDISPSQGIEALMYAKEKADNFHTPLNEKEYQKFIQWFYKQGNIRIKKENNFKTRRRQYNRSINARPSIMVNRPYIDPPPDRNFGGSFYQAGNPLTPNPSAMPTYDTSNEEYQFSSQAQTLFKDSKLPSLK
mmetsp:Transcript_22024/g.21760  ORF Transcript_22024/g.21760 Transcript_22024/m.21760 type:complete len:176 (-) Transcript_22024:342-869(-)|eukprot:CAMPEP_0197014446 /NCGR_PEP_ID=MMETSP1380-20130617/70362_1 /TAXON_ID=5936 /ORGANISM="Euplotes crassus, Strain CT5" /LENGTH=175 /DNA_ID=CAMNT_0042439509 /DNA_START=1 /DNA_END=528 /DNA_ORIENTATION=+